MNTKLLRFALAAILVFACQPLAAQTPTEPKPADEKPAFETVDPTDRPEGAINDQSARIYVWHDTAGWHVRTTARNLRTFTGSIRVKDAKITSCVSVGLKKDNKQADAWEVNAARNELRFKFQTGKLSDGFDLAVKGDEGQIEFDLQIEGKSERKQIFLGRARKHPSKSPFTYPANPKATAAKPATSEASSKP